MYAFSYLDFDCYRSRWGRDGKEEPRGWIHVKGCKRSIRGCKNLTSQPTEVADEWKVQFVNELTDVKQNVLYIPDDQNWQFSMLKILYVNIQELLFCF